jgi:hypothetical protein
MRSETDAAKLQRFMAALGTRVRSDGAVYLTGGATAVLHHWRAVRRSQSCNVATTEICATCDPLWTRS